MDIKSVVGAASNTNILVGVTEVGAIVSPDETTAGEAFSAAGGGLVAARTKASHVRMGSVVAAVVAIYRGTAEASAVARVAVGSGIVGVAAGDASGLVPSDTSGVDVTASANMVAGAAHAVLVVDEAAAAPGA